MRKGIVLTKRDVQLMRHLSFGPATGKSIFINIFDKEGAATRTRRRVMMRRLVKLEEEGLIARKVSHTYRDYAYTLTKDAAPIVAGQFGVELTSVWASFNDKHIDHDLHVAGIARRLVRESEEKHLYELLFLVLECELRRRRKVFKGIYFPDLTFGLQGTGSKKSFDLEVDFGTVTRNDFLGKIRYFEKNILVVTSNEKRLDLLLWYVKDACISKPVYLTTLKEFYDNTLITCSWATSFTNAPISLSIN
jgi:hypothetical protein